MKFPKIGHTHHSFFRWPTVHRVTLDTRPRVVLNVRKATTRQQWAQGGAAQQLQAQINSRLAQQLHAASSSSYGMNPMRATVSTPCELAQNLL